MTAQFPRLFWWHVVRHLRQHRMLALLNVLSIALGVAVYLAIQIANHSANRSFSATVDLVAGKAHLEVRGSVDELLWPKLEKQPGVKAVTGLVEGIVTLPDFPGEYLRVLGVDIFSGEAFRTFELSGQGDRLDLERWLGEGGIAVTPEFARERGLRPGDRLRVTANSIVRELPVITLLQAEDSPAAAQARFAVMDIGWAQELFGTQGRLSSLQFLLEDPTRGEPVAAALTAQLPPDLRAEPPRQRSFQLQNLLGAFQLNLTALSMVSMLVGVFLIYNTISASVTRRRVEIGILRALGTTRNEVRWLFLGEAALFGALGIVLGTIGGVLLAQALVGAVAKTITSLYVLLSLDRGVLHPWQLCTAAGFGFGAVLVGAWVPANEAARLDPAGSLSMGAHLERSVARVPRWHGWGLVALVLAAGVSWLALETGPPLLAFIAAFLVLAGFALFSPIATSRIGKAATHIAPDTIWWRLAADHLQRSVQRNAITVAALSAAIAMVVGLTVMIHSFRQSLTAWLDRGIVADLFIAPAANEIVGLGANLPPAAIDWLRARPEVGGVDTFREQEVAVKVHDSAPQPALLAVVQGEYRANLQFVGGNAEAKMRRVFRGEAIAVSEPLARRLKLRENDRLTLLTPRGPVAFSIAGIYADYSRDRGILLMSRRAFDQSWQEPGVHSLAVYLQPGIDPASLLQNFRARFGQEGEFAIYSNRDLRTRIFLIFDQTFAVTYILRTVAIIVAIAGIFLSVTTLVAERERETGVLRAVGGSNGQIHRMFMAEAGLLGATATLLGLLAGSVLAMVLTWVVNPAFFGWTFTLRFPWTTLAALPLWIIPAATLAAWQPARRATQAVIATAMREE